MPLLDLAIFFNAFVTFKLNNALSDLFFIKWRKMLIYFYFINYIITGVCIVLAAGSEIQVDLQFNIFSFSPFVAFTGGANLATPPHYGPALKHNFSKPNS